METTTDDYGNLIYFSDVDGEPMKECCVLAEPFTCGDCWGGTERDPYVNGSAEGWRTPQVDYYDAGRLRH